MRAMDFYSQLFLERRAYETTRGNAAAAREAGRDALIAAVREERPREGLARAIALLRDVPVDRSQRRMRIGITGDYYTRVCDFANGGIFRDIERLGGVVMLPPTMSEFVKYDAHQLPTAAFHHRRWGELAQRLVARGAIERRERRVRALFADLLDYDIPLDYRRTRERFARYIDPKLPAGLTGSVAAILEQIAAGADGVLNLITFQCSYGLVIASTLALIRRDHPDLPMLTLIFEGLEPTHNRTRLEAFLERVRERSAKAVVTPCAEL